MQDFRIVLLLCRYEHLEKNKVKIRPDGNPMPEFAHRADNLLNLPLNSCRIKHKKSDEIHIFRLNNTITERVAIIAFTQFKTLIFTVDIAELFSPI